MELRIILRKVKGISGLTPVMRSSDGLRYAGGGGGPGIGAILFSPLTMFALAFALLVAFILAHPAHGGHVALSPMTFVAGNLAVQLKSKQDELVAKQKAIHDVFEAAGTDFDFNKPAVLTLVGAKSSAEVVEKVRAMNDELTEIGKSRDGLVEMKRIHEDVEKSRNDPARVLPFPGGGGTGDPDQPKQRKTLGQMIVESRAFKGLSQGQSGMSEEKGFGLIELKTLFQTSAGWSPESTRTGLLVDKATRPIQVLDIIPTGNTQQAAVVYMEETTRTHSAAERAEAAAAAESVFALTQRSETVRSIGDSIPVTDEQLADVAQAESYLNQRLGFGVRQRLDNQVINGDGNAPNLTGILAKSGIQTQAKGADSIPDAVYKAMVKVRVTGRAVPNAYITHPTDWQGVRLLKTADGIYIWGSPSEAGPARIWGIQVVEADVIAQGTGLVGDFANFIQLFERQGIEIVAGYVNDDLVKFKRTIRAGMRVALAIYRAAAFATVTGL